MVLLLASAGLQMRDKEFVMTRDLFNRSKFTFVFLSLFFAKPTTHSTTSLVCPRNRTRELPGPW